MVDGWEGAFQWRHWKAQCTTMKINEIKASKG